MVATLKNIHAADGTAGLFKGIVPRIGLGLLPFVAGIYWTWNLFLKRDVADAIYGDWSKNGEGCNRVEENCHSGELPVKNKFLLVSTYACKKGDQISVGYTLISVFVQFSVLLRTIISALFQKWALH